MLGSALLAGLAACGTAPPPKDGGGGNRRVIAAPNPVKVGGEEVDGRVVVTAVDRDPRGAVSIEVRNETDEFLPDLAYVIVLWYRNQSTDPKKLDVPLIPWTTPKRRLDLDARETATLRTRPEDKPRPGATIVELKLVRETPRATRVDDTYLSDRIRVVAHDKIDWHGSDPRASFTVANEWDSPLRMQFKVQLIQDDKVVAETEWRIAPGALQPKATMVLEARLKGILGGKTIPAGTWPALKVRRPNI